MSIKNITEKANRNSCHVPLNVQFLVKHSYKSFMDQAENQGDKTLHVNKGCSLKNNSVGHFSATTAS